MQLIDTHTHLDFEMFDDDRAQVIARARNAGVERIVVLGVHAANWQRVWQLACDEPSVHAALGLHPVFLEQHQDAHVQQLRDWLERLRGEPKLCAVGEIGLDYYIDNPDIERQQRLLEAQLALAADFSLPVLLHVRRAHAPMIATLKRYKLERSGVIHAFSGSWEEAREYLRLGFRLGLGGAGTWPQAQRMHRVLRQLPLEAIVLETDAPDIPPAGHAGERNSPELLPEICRRLADLKGIDAHALAAASYRNSCELFGWR
ncbi:TatD family deoxyribonuclease [Stutzerimonas stutzeri]|uniref:TatD family hydrolase n=1 Tax=Stutzerimonas stutzeri TaxID=316 RepID=UPI000BA95810|nr:TatD family hydrolase [Stutzerimonas stutzeri]PAO92252.1 hydrolase TatD [Stutzerimonas stutzeri]RRV83308.1 TatD family deoxyribonuclease [Stutzerimonas stutzeri]RRV93134.1 TatD family deoxyribonuclease [Stutzerimonas stutzeri]RRV94244.1 TatD family deoxyribonuclease [Stutzerimonas stutzeri]RRV97660.1 TatD family deoxyribonuclease [Stutzerimonas stutzeri]